ncbi:diguanylate cyclase domain-containing protein [Desulfoplanes sp.]
MNSSDQNDTRPKILIVDDNKQNIELLMELFRGEYRIAAAVNAARAMKIALSDSPPDLILTDILMPDVDGYQLCGLLKENPATKDIPIIFVTAVSEVMDENRGFALGAVDYITKPFHPPMVKARVRLHLNLKRKQELLEQFAFIDALTEIPNRRRFDEVMASEWNRATRTGTPLSLIFMDIDHFKEYNDTYGHGRGDDCLREVAGAIKRSMRRAGDFVARYGGEEFAVVLPYVTHAEAMVLAERIQTNVGKLAIRHDASDVAEYVSLSLGVATSIPRQGTAGTTLLEAADKMLYGAKDTGRNTLRGIDLV